MRSLRTSLRLNGQRNWVTHLGEAEEKPDSTAQFEGVVDGLLQLVQAWLADGARRQARGVDVVGRAAGGLKMKGS